MFAIPPCDVYCLVICADVYGTSFGRPKTTDDTIIPDLPAHVSRDATQGNVLVCAIFLLTFIFHLSCVLVCAIFLLTFIFHLSCVCVPAGLVVSYLHIYIYPAFP